MNEKAILVSERKLHGSGVFVRSVGERLMTKPNELRLSGGKIHKAWIDEFRS